MGKNLLVGVGGKARHVKALYVGVGGKARKVKKVYVGVGGKARLVYQSYVAVSGINVGFSEDKNHLTVNVSVYPSIATIRGVSFSFNKYSENYATMELVSTTSTSCVIGFSSSCYYNEDSGAGSCSYNLTIIASDGVKVTYRIYAHQAWDKYVWRKFTV